MKKPVDVPVLLQKVERLLAETPEERLRRAGDRYSTQTVLGRTSAGGTAARRGGLHGPGQWKDRRYYAIGRGFYRLPFTVSLKDGTPRFEASSEA